MGSIGEKLKMPKTYEKKFYKHNTGVVCKKQLQKTSKTPNMRRF